MQQCLGLVVVAVMVGRATAAGCNGHSTPGARNTNPIDTAPPRFVREIKNGKLYTIGQVVTPSHEDECCFSPPTS